MTKRTLQEARVHSVWRTLLVCSLAMLPCLGATPSPPQDKQGSKEAFMEQLRQVGSEALLEQLRGLRGDVQAAAATAKKDGKFEVSTDVFTWGNIDEKVIARINGRREAIRRIIWLTAEQLEKKEQASVTFDEGAAAISVSQQDTAARLSQAINQGNISMRSLALAVNMFVDVSKGLYDAATQEKNAEKKYSLYIEYTALVYELSAIVVDMLENFKPEGLAELKALHEERKTEIDKVKGRVRNRIDLYEQRKASGEIGEEAFKSAEARLNGYLDALNSQLTAWQQILTTVDQQKAWADKVRTKSQTFRDLRDESGLQLEILREIGITKVVLKQLESLKDILAIKDVPLLKLDSSVVRDLLGLTSEIPVDR